MKQISLTVPENLLALSKEYSEEFGYKNVQEFILDLIRKKVVIEDIERYKKIEERMKKGVGVKKFDKKGAKKYLKSF